MENTLTKNKRFEEACSIVAVVLVGLIFLILAVASIMQTCRIDSESPAKEIINFDNDAIPVNLALIVLSCLAFIALMRKHIRMSKVITPLVVFIMVIVTTVASMVWVNLSQSLPISDSQTMLTTAKQAAQGQYSKISDAYYSGYSYYAYYPSKLGFVFFAEILYRIFGAKSSALLFQITNIIALDCVYVGVVMCTNRIFRRRAVTNMTAIALTLCIQPMLMTTYAGGALIGLAFAVWSVFFTIRYMQDNKFRFIALAAPLNALAVLMQPHYFIVAIALFITLILHTIGSKRFLAMAAAAIICLCSFVSPKLVTAMYSARTHTQLSSGMPLKLDYYVGIGESTMSPGWFNWNGVTTFAKNDLDPGDSEKAAQEGIDAQLTKLNRENLLGDYYKKKFLSQFNEPSFQSIWVSQVSDHKYNHTKENVAPKQVTSVYTGGLNKLLGYWFDYYNMMIYAGFAAGMICILIRRKANAVTAIFPFTVLGAVIYLMIGEAKSMFFLPYFILLIPFTMFGLLEVTRLLTAKTGILFKKTEAEPAAG